MPATSQPRRRTARLALALAVAACGGGKPLPSYLSQADVDHPKFPRFRYVTAVGISSQSADDAGAQAKRAVSERISSQLQAETDSFMSASNAGGQSSEAQRITSRVRTSIPRGEPAPRRNAHASAAIRQSLPLAWPSLKLLIVEVPLLTQSKIIVSICF